MSSLIQQLKNIRLKQGLTQSDLADKVGLPQSSIARIESERISTRLSNFEELVHTLGHEILIVPKEQVVAVEALLTNSEQYTELSEMPLYSLTEFDNVGLRSEETKRADIRKPRRALKTRKRTK